MKKKRWKLLFIICILFMLMSINLYCVQAGGVSDILTGVEGFESAKDSLDPDSVTGGSQLDQTKVKQASDMVYNILLTVGIIVAVIVGLIIGIKFMTGSIDQKAQVKETLIPYIAGCVVIFGAFGIWKLVLTFTNQLA